MAATSTPFPVAPTTTATTVAGAFRFTVDRVPDRPALRMRGSDDALTWAQLRDRVDELAGGLHALGLRRGDTIALMIGNRPEFHICDLAAMQLGAIPFSIYQTSSPEQIEYFLKDSAARIAIVEPIHAERFAAAAAGVETFEQLIVTDDEPVADAILLDEAFAACPDGFDVGEHWRAVEPEDLLTLIYTSGTTGPPKGVMLTHANLIAATAGFNELVEFPDGGRVISWLPAAHVAERNAHHYIPIVFGMTVTSCPNPREIIAVLPEVRPHWFFAVPRIWEKLKAGLEAMIETLPPQQREATQAALAASVEKIRLEQRGEPVPEELAAQVAAADEAIFSKLRAQLGLDEVAAINVGAAPTPVEVLEFFHAIGLRLSELWGMSESCGAGSVNPMDHMKLGTVGTAAPQIELKLADDGELLVKSAVVMKGYFNMPEKTAETIDADGWLHTGDIAEVDDEGYFKIVDRKKELIISSSGKNMSPANIEAALKAASPLIGNACTIGDRRAFNTALIVLDADYTPVWAQSHGITETSLEELAQNDQVRAAVAEGVEAGNAKLSQVEQVKRFHIIQGDWLPGGAELTETMKLKRKPIAAKYAEVIEGLYAAPR
jgi:long-chain acyl-CoA synthetase